MSRARICHRLKAWALGFFLSGFCLAGCGWLALCPVPAGAAGTATPGGDPATDLRWPLDLPAHWLTSNFMEYRGGRFHAGIDLKTRETEGFPAYAVEDGWISRLRATPGGYGRAVYLRGASGRTYVYAHLGRFNDRLGALVAATQQRDGAYRVELEPAPGSLMVRRGDVLGLTGQSGTTGPHLHFEVRLDGGCVDPMEYL
jgi:murein DD-endopeptidase MepM/ murein hydrolase activator NlpD